MHKLTTKPLRDTKATLSIGESKKTLTGLDSKFMDKWREASKAGNPLMRHQVPLDYTNTTKHTP